MVNSEEQRISDVTYEVLHKPLSLEPGSSV